MSAGDGLYLLAASGHLTLALLCLLRGRRSPVARPLALLCLDMFGWCFASLAQHLTGMEIWGGLDAVCTDLTPPLVLLLIVTFVGARRTYPRAVLAAWVVFGMLALSSGAACFASWGHAWLGSTAWATLFLAGWAPTLAFVLVLLLRHLVGASDADEKARTRTMLAALALGGTLASLDMVGKLGLGLPHLASIGTLVSTGMVATAVFRVRLLDRELSASTAVYAVSLALTGAIAYVASARLLGGNVTALVFATLAVTFVLAAAVREVVSSLAVERERSERHAVLGRFSSQMAHDLKNPLATLKGALQFLQEERAHGRSLDAQHEFLPIMLEQVDRLQRVVDDYQRIGRVQPVRRPVDLNDVVRSVVALEPFAAERVAMHAELADDLPACELDADLVSAALQNVIRNALEAMPDGGKMTVRTARADGGDGAGVVLSVQDAGQGMDARHAERAFDDFYTTKATGSGLGLAFVRRVAEAHGGDVALSSRIGVGTTVRMRLPAR